MQISQLVLILTERQENKDVPGKLQQSTTEKIDIGLDKGMKKKHRLPNF